jgi:hypothetical protein
MFQRFLPLLLLLTAGYGADHRPLADVPIPLPDRKIIHFKQYAGKELVIVLVSTACEDCLRTITILNKIQQDYGPRGLQVLGAAINNNAPYEIAGFVQRYRPAFPIGYLDQTAAIKLADIPKDTRPFVPIIMFTDRKGWVQVQYYGDSPIFKASEEKAFRAIAEGLLKFGQEKAPAEKQAAPSATKQ